MNTENPENDLLKAISRIPLGDRNAFNFLYEQTSAKLFGICLRILGNKAEAEDALQEIYIKIWHNSDRFAQHKLHDKGTPIAWLATIARNHSIDLIRKRKPVSREIDDAFEIADAKPGPEDMALASGQRTQLDECFDELEKDRAIAVRKAYLEGFSYQELAEHFGIPINTMRTWLRRGLAALRDCMEGKDT